MNILLVNPNIPHVFKFMDYCDEEAKQGANRRVLVGPPLGLNMIAGMLGDENVRIVDQKAEVDNNPDYDYFKELECEIINFKPDIVGFTCLTAQYNNVIKLLEITKRMDRNILTVVGGIHPSSCPQDFIGSHADIISIGLGRHSFYNIVKELKNNRRNPDFSKIPGLAIHKEHGLTFTKHLGEFCYTDFREKYLFENVIPNRELTDRYDYRVPGVNKRIHYISTSQGCTHQCNFCYLWQMTNGRYYHREVESIIDELKQMDKYDIIRLCDANTFGDIKKIKLLFERIIEEGLDKHEYLADLRTDTVNDHPALIDLAVRAGLKVAICGLEATSDDELKSYNKSNSVAGIKTALRTLNDKGVFVNGNYILRPEYTKEDFHRLATFIEENPIFNSGLTVLTPFPGTEQWDEWQDQIIIKDYDYYNLANAVTKTHLPIETFYKEMGEVLKVSKRAGMGFVQKLKKVM